VKTSNSHFNSGYLFILSLALMAQFVHAETNDEIQSNVIQSAGVMQTIGSRGRFLANTRIIQVDSDHVEKIVLAKSKMREIQRTSNDKGGGPQTIEEAAAYLSRRINMACPPTFCFEYQNIFYFSGGITTQPIEDFSSGLAVRKGEPTIFEWNTTDLDE